jgi:hypothetical protein
MLFKVGSFILSSLLLAFLVLPIFATAKIGVGVGTGSIKIGESLNAGKGYALPAFVVLNTGDQPSEYGVRIAHRENQPEMKPDEAWFRFEPSSFNLGPGESQLVQVFLDLPIRGAWPGDYFAFLQARPIVVAEVGVASVGVAAASQLRFTIEPSNIFQAAYYKFSDWYSHYHPWNTVVLVILSVALVLIFLKRKFKIQIARK